MSRCPARLTTNMATADAIATIADGNSDAAQVLCRMVVLDELALGDDVYDWLHSLDNMGVYGDDLWRGYKDFCHESLYSLYAVVVHHDAAFVTYLGGWQAQRA